MEELIYKLNGVRMLDVVEEEMIQLWLRNDTIPYLLKEDEEFVSVVTSAIMLERGFWSKYMVVGLSLIHI